MTADNTSKVYVEMSRTDSGKIRGFDYYLMPWESFTSAVEEVMEETERATIRFTIRRYTQDEYDNLNLDN